MQRFSAVSAITILLAFSSNLAGDQRQLEFDEVTESKALLRWQRPVYRNYALTNYVQYPNHTIPYEDSPRRFFGFTGNHLIDGYDLFKWSETRQPGQRWGSSIFKHSGSASGGGAFNQIFDSVIVGRDSYADWGYSAIVGDALLARFTPLTLSMANFNGARFDLATPQFRFTFLGSRIERPKAYVEVPPPWSDGDIHFADDSTMLLGSRLETTVGRLQLGFNWVNQHIYQSTTGGNSLKGRLRPGQPIMQRILVRFSDDSPLDGVSGAAIQDVNLIINGEFRADIAPRVVTQRRGIRPQVGVVSQATGEFRSTDYTVITTGTPRAVFFFGGKYFRDREMPLYSDFLIRLDHEDGEDVSSVANLPGLLANFTVPDVDQSLRADGDLQAVYIFDLSQEPRVESVEVEALVGNDYRVDVATLIEQNPRGKTYHSRFRSTFYHTALRATGNVQDLSNVRRVRIPIGENTGQFVYGADMQLELAGFQLRGELARSNVYSRYAAFENGEAAFDDGPRFSERGSAYYLNANRWFGRGRIGGEYFAMKPTFTTELRTYLNFDVNLTHTNVFGVGNQTLYWKLVEDNDDGDRYPDLRYGNMVGLVNDAMGVDPDGVFLEQDDDNDGWPDTNRNLNRVADYEEPFLMYGVEPNIYTYGLDRNNNDEPDHREDDYDVDYPYDPDQRGIHLFAEWNLTERWALSAGMLRVNEVAGGGRNRSLYGLLSYRRTALDRVPNLFFENHLRRVQDDIADEYVVNDDDPGTRTGGFGFRGYFYEGNRNIYPPNEGPPVFFSTAVPDLLFYRDSMVNDSHLDLEIRPWSALKVVQRLRARFNWQEGGRLYNGQFQRDRRVDFWTWVSRVEYTWHLGRVRITPQYKFMLLRLMDRDARVDLLAESRSIPILRVEAQLLSRTSLRAGIQGFAGLPYRLSDRTSERNSFDQRTAFISVLNRSGYFGYDLVTIVGLGRDQREYGTGFRDARNFDSLTLFVRAIVGFTEFGRVL